MGLLHIDEAPYRQVTDAVGRLLWQDGETWGLTGAVGRWLVTDARLVEVSGETRPAGASAVIADALHVAIGQAPADRWGIDLAGLAILYLPYDYEEEEECAEHIKMTACGTGTEIEVSMDLNGVRHPLPAYKLRVATAAMLRYDRLVNEPAIAAAVDVLRHELTQLVMHIRVYGDE